MKNYRALLLLLLLLVPFTVGAEDGKRDVVLVLDNSGSMKNNDPEFLTPKAVEQFINGLDSNTRAAIIIFDQSVNLAVPLTEVTDESRARLLASLKKINYRGKYTDSPSAIERAIYELKSNGREDAEKAIIFMTDGIVDTGKPELDVEKTRWLRDDLTAEAADADIRIFAIAFTEAADFLLIQTLARRTEAEYFRALTAADIPEAFKRVNEVLSKPKEEPAPPPPPPPPQVAPPPAATAEPEPAPAPESALQGPEGAESGVVVVYPPEQEASDRRKEMIVIIGIAAVILLLVVIIVVLLLRRRGAGGGRSVPEHVPQAFLNDINGYTADPSYELGAKPVMLGRVAGKESDLEYIVINQSTVGRRHAIIEYKDYSYWIIDQGSVNGTFVNGEQIDDERRLKHGDRIKLHKFEFEFVMPELSESGKTVFSGQTADDGAMEKTVMAQAAPEAPRAAPAAAAAAADADMDIFEVEEAEQEAELPVPTSDDETQLTADEEAVDLGDLEVETPDQEAEQDIFDLGEAEPETAEQVEPEPLAETADDDVFDLGGEDVDVAAEAPQAPAATADADVFDIPDTDEEASSPVEEEPAAEDIFEIPETAEAESPEAGEELDQRLERAAAMLDAAEAESGESEDEAAATMFMDADSAMAEAEQADDDATMFMDADSAVEEAGQADEAETMLPAEEPAAADDDATMFMDADSAVAETGQAEEAETMLPAEEPAVADDDATMFMDADSAVSEAEEEAAAPSEDETVVPEADGEVSTTFSEAETVLPESHRQAAGEDEEDITMDDFIDSNIFEAPSTPAESPPQGSAPPSDEAETIVNVAADEDATMMPDQVPETAAEASGGDEDEDDELSLEHFIETTVINGSKKADADADETVLSGVDADETVLSGSDSDKTVLSVDEDDPDADRTMLPSEVDDTPPRK